MIIDKEKVQSAKEKLGDRTPGLIAGLLHLQEFDERSLKALCPVHSENTPSFIYNPKMHNFHCFGCGCNIDIIDAYMMSGDTYLTAVEKLFNETGVLYSFGERGVKTLRNYRYPEQTKKGDRSLVDAYFATRKLTKATLDHCDVRQDEHGNAVFNYYDINDVLTMVKYRPSRKIDKTKGEIKTWCQKGADTTPLLFNMNRVNISQPLLITEGECDTMAAIEAGYTNSVSVPFGSQNHHWIEQNWEWLDQFSEIIICSDNDEAGIKMAQDVCPRLGSWRTKIVDIPAVDSATGRRIKDLNELLYYQGKDAVLNVILNAKESPVDSVVDLSDIEDKNISELDGIYFGIDELDKELFKLFFGTLTLVTGTPGCVSADTEFFNGHQWKRIDQYTAGEKVLQYNSDGSAELVEPLQYHKYECDHFWKIKSYDSAVDQLVSDEHNLVYMTLDNKLQKNDALDFIRRHERSIRGHTARFITAFQYGGNGIACPDIELRIMCAVICRGIFYKPKETENGAVYKARIDLRYEWQQQRMRILLRRCGISWEERKVKTTVKCVRFTFVPPAHENTFSERWYGCSNEQFRIVTDEILAWCWGKTEDGILISSVASREDADFIQFAFAATGRRTKIRKLKNGGYDITVPYGSCMCSLQYKTSGKLEIPKVKSPDGFKYCFTVPSGMLVLRHNNRINVTGNSGKTSFLYQIICNALEQGRCAWIYSRELPDYMSKSWLNYLLAGPRNLEEFTSSSGSTYYKVTNQAKRRINEAYRGQWFVYKDEWPNDIESIKESMEAAARKFGSKLFLLDNLMTIDLHSSDENRWDKQTELINWLIQFSFQFNVCTILVAHPRKMLNSASTVDLYDIGGSSNLINLAHRTLALRRVRNDEKEDGKSKYAQYSCVVTVTKDRMRGRAGFELGMYYDEASRRFYTKYEEYDRKYKWDKNNYNSRLHCPALDTEQEVYGAPCSNVVNTY